MQAAERKVRFRLHRDRRQDLDPVVDGVRGGR
jgi:hypothetical protein